MSEKRKGRLPWNTGKICPQISEACIGRSMWNKGVPRTQKEKQKMTIGIQRFEESDRYEEHRREDGENRFFQTKIH
jgi:hypothetical protein